MPHYPNQVVETWMDGWILCHSHSPSRACVVANLFCGAKAFAVLAPGQTGGVPGGLREFSDLRIGFKIFVMFS